MNGSQDDHLALAADLASGSETLFQVSLVVPQAALLIFEAAFEDTAVSLASFEIAGQNDWRIDAYFSADPKHSAMRPRLALAAAAAHIDAPVLTIERLVDEDWVTRSQEFLQPVHSGEFFIHGSHDRHRRPARAIAIEIEAGPAFGTGQHETTYGCLQAISWLARRGQAPQRPLDLGSGSGILAIAMARRWQTLGERRGGRNTVTASDIDPRAVQEIARNALKNRVARDITPVIAAGFNSPALAGEFDLIVANILAGPLLALAPAIARHNAVAGHLVLSGLLRRQALALLTRYRAQGYRLVRRLDAGDWSTLILSRVE